MAEVGICGSDLRIFAGDGRLYPLPVTLGHEAWGVVEDGDMPTGSRVALFPLIGCGRCRGCCRDDPSLCSELRVVGGDLPGGLANWLCAPIENLVVLPPDLPDDLAVLVEPTAVAIRAARRAAVTPGEDVLVVGLGAIGLLTALVARRAGTRVLTVGHHRARQDLAQACGLECLGAEVAHGLAEVDVAFACAPGPDVARDVIAAIGPGGRAVLSGSGSGVQQVSGDQLYRGNRSVLGSAMYDRADFIAAAEALADGLLAGTVGRSGVRATYSLDQLEAAFIAMEAGTLAAAKAVIRIDGAAPSLRSADVRGPETRPGEG
jgi:L-iditol 2-dehydrogenase